MYRASVECAKHVGFDGVDVMSAIGYLIDQILQSSANLRTDMYGSPFENHVRFLLEIVNALKSV